MPALPEVLLPERERLALRDPDLRLHEVDAGHHLGHRVLDLEPGVHLEEAGIEVRVDEELERPGVDVAGALHERHREIAHLLPQRGGEEGGRALLDHLLVPPLDGALALEEVDDVAVVVGEDLDLDVPRPRERLLEVDALVAEGAPGLGSRAGECLASSAGRATSRRPLPPPPAAALSITG